jgi:hypothetical protein
MFGIETLSDLVHNTYINVVVCCDYHRLLYISVDDRLRSVLYKFIVCDMGNGARIVKSGGYD